MPDRNASIISIHSPHARGDAADNRRARECAYFNPLPSCEGRHGWRHNCFLDNDFNPLPSCEGRPFYNLGGTTPGISIHSPHARGDHLLLRLLHPGKISIHSPHARGDDMMTERSIKFHTFQSTPLMRGETAGAPFYVQANWISIHSPHARGDLWRQRALRCRLISIHSPHARGDRALLDILPVVKHFNPLPSCEGRLKICADFQPLGLFQSTPLMRGETSAVCRFFAEMGISIHSPHARGDQTIFDMIGGNNHFNPLPSCEGRRDQINALIEAIEFQSTPLMRGETGHLFADLARQSYFNPLPSCEGRLDC